MESRLTQIFDESDLFAYFIQILIMPLTTPPIAVKKSNSSTVVVCFRTNTHGANVSTKNEKEIRDHVTRYRDKGIGFAAKVHVPIILFQIKAYEIKNSQRRLFP